MDVHNLVDLGYRVYQALSSDQADVRLARDIAKQAVEDDELSCLVLSAYLYILQDTLPEPIRTHVESVLVKFRLLINTEVEERLHPHKVVAAVREGDVAELAKEATALADKYASVDEPSRIYAYGVLLSLLPSLD